MARFTYRSCKVCKTIHGLHEWPEDCLSHFGEAPRQATYVRPDGMDPIKSMVSGKMHDSRSSYYREVRAAGCEIVGNDREGFGPRPEYRPTGLKEALKAALERHS